MIVTSRPDLKATLLNNLEKKNMKDRSGIHLSDLDGCLKKAYYRKTAPISPTERQLMLYFLGWAVQHEALGDDEKYIDIEGIEMSLDSVQFKPFLEFKTTRQSLKNFKTEEHNQWVQRIKGYCYASGEIEALLSVVFLNGDYKPPLPGIEVYALEFTEEEIAANWTLVLEKKEILAAALAQACPPDVDFHENWECEFCESNCPGRCFGRVKLPKGDK